MFLSIFVLVFIFCFFFSHVPFVTLTIFFVGNAICLPSEVYLPREKLSFSFCLSSCRVIFLFFLTCFCSFSFVFHVCFFVSFSCFFKLFLWRIVARPSPSFVVLGLPFLLGLGRGCPATTPRGKERRRRGTAERPKRSEEESSTTPKKNCRKQHHPKGGEGGFAFWLVGPPSLGLGSIFLFGFVVGLRSKGQPHAKKEGARRPTQNPRRKANRTGFPSFLGPWGCPCFSFLLGLGVGLPSQSSRGSFFLGWGQASFAGSGSRHKGRRGTANPNTRRKFKRREENGSTTLRGREGEATPPKNRGKSSTTPEQEEGWS